MTLTPATCARCGYRGAMGFNPFREQVQRRSDIVLVVAAFVVVAALVAWAFLGG